MINRLCNTIVHPARYTNRRKEQMRLQHPYSDNNKYIIVM